jgi:aminopeptidase S
MPATWLYVAGGIFLAMLIFVIAYNLLTMHMIQAQKQNALANFNDLYTNIETVCLQEINNSMLTKISIPTSVRVIYVTGDTKNPLPIVIEKIKNEEINTERNLCMQFVDEQILRCKKLTCNVTMPYMGSLPEHMDIKIMVKKILGEAPVREYSLLIVKTAGNEVTTTTNLTAMKMEMEMPITTTSITTTTSIVSTTTSIPSECSPDELVNLVDANVMIENIKELTKNPRPYGSDWNRQTAEYIKDKLESYGLENVHFEDFGLSGRNVVGEIGSGSNIIVVTGGHRDSVSAAPGAIDNAAGSATVMESARVLASCKDLIKNYRLRFVLFDAEEIGLVGSGAYATEHIDRNRENINRMLNFDCVGHKDATGLIVFRTADDLSNSADKCCEMLNIDCEREFSTGDGSDQISFSRRGVKVLFVINKEIPGHDGNAGQRYCGRCYHSSCDNLSEVGSTQMGWAGKLATCILSDLYLK